LQHHLRQERSLSHGDYLGLLSPSLRKAYEHTLALGLLPPLSPPPSAAGAFGIAVQAQVDESAPLLASPSAAEETAQDEAARAEAEKVLEAAQAISLPVFVLSRLARYLAAARAAGCLKDAGQPSFAMVRASPAPPPLLAARADVHRTFNRSTSCSPRSQPISATKSESPR
jgi:hypothetical protein